MIDEYATITSEIKHDDSTPIRSDVSETSGDTGGGNAKQADAGSEALVTLSETAEEETEQSADTQTYEVTAYTAGVESTGKTPNDPAYGITASGEKVTEGITIACPPSLPFGTRVHIESIGERVCLDRGSAITAGHIDVYMADLSSAQAFGRQTLEVTVIGED